MVELETIKPCKVVLFTESGPNLSFDGTISIGNILSHGRTVTLDTDHMKFTSDHGIVGYSLYSEGELIHYTSFKVTGAVLNVCVGDTLTIGWGLSVYGR